MMFDIYDLVLFAYFAFLIGGIYWMHRKGWV